MTLLFSFPTGLCVRESDSAKTLSTGGASEGFEEELDDGGPDEPEDALLWVTDSRNSAVRQLTIADDAEISPEDEAAMQRAQADANAVVAKSVDKAERRATIARRKRFSVASASARASANELAALASPLALLAKTTEDGGGGTDGRRVSVTFNDPDLEPLSPGSPQQHPPGAVFGTMGLAGAEDNNPAFTNSSSSSSSRRNSSSSSSSLSPSRRSSSRRALRIARPLPKITRTRVAVATTLIGGEEEADGDEEEGQVAMRSGNKDGTFAKATMEQPVGVAFNSMLQELHVSDFFNNNVRKVHWPNGGPCVLDPLPPAPELEPGSSSSGSDSDDDDDDDDGEVEDDEEGDEEEVEEEGGLHEGGDASDGENTVASSLSSGTFKDK
jgi:hypothetical protein